MGVLGRILIVDDEALVRDVLGEYFSAQGYQVELADGGEAALAAVERSRPDLVLLDIRMPGLDGLEVLRRLRPLDHGLPVIMVTANEDVVLARETLKIGAFDYVAKPFDFAYLDRAVTAALTQTGRRPEAGAVPAAARDAAQALAVTVFRAVRSMGAEARQSTGQRMESAALAAAREVAQGRTAVAEQHLGELTVLCGIAADLGDLPGAERGRLEAAVAAARRSLAPPR